MSYFNKLAEQFNPFTAYVIEGKATREFVDYVLKLIDTNLSQAYATFKNIKTNKVEIQLEYYLELEEAIKKAYNVQKNGTWPAYK
jgi:ribosomal protein S8